MRARSRIGLRPFVGLMLCGIAAGFTVPAIASSLIRQERRQPDVRLVPAPRVPRVELSPPGADAVGSHTSETAPQIGKVVPPKPLTRSQLERKNPPPTSRLFPRPPVVGARREAAPVATSPTSGGAPPSTAPKPTTSKAGGTGAKESGGVESPSGAGTTGEAK